MSAAEKTVHGSSSSSTASALSFNKVIPQSFVDRYIKSPGEFIVPNAAARAAAIDVVGKTYDAANATDKFGLYDDWNAVVKSGFDPSEQLWELISFRNEPVLSYSTDMMKQLSQLLDSARIGSDSEDDSGSDLEDGQSISESLDEEEEDEDEESVGSSLDDASLASDIVSSADEEEEEEEDRAKRSVVDDDFFSLAEMEEFADEAEEEDMRDRAILAGDYPKTAANDVEESDDSDEDDDEDNVDMFQDLAALDDEDSGDEDEMDVDKGNRPEEMMYADFFKAPKGSKRGMAKAAREKHAKRVKFDPSAVRESDDDDDNDDNVQESDVQGDNDDSPKKADLFGDDSEDDDNGGAEAKSEFEKRQEKLQGLITKLEDEAVDSKHWTMTGEVTSSARPKDSLLGESLEFDYVQKPVPVVTQEATQTIEDMIKRRILNEEWDDVERKKDIQAKPFRPSGFIELNDKASKKSLAEEYEDQYLAQKSGDQFVPEKDAKLDELHKDIKGQMRGLFTQLDALSHFHYAPKPATADIEIRTNTAALTMEEKLPVNVSQAEQLAPEEIFEKNKGYNGRTGDLKGDTELSREERKRRRQRKKEMYKKKTAAIEGEKKAKAAADAKSAKAANPGKAAKAKATTTAAIAV